MKPVPAAARHWLDQAARLSRWGRPGAAIEAYNQARAVALDAGARYTACIGIARSFEALGESKRAIAACREAILVSPDQPPAYGVLALLLMREGRLEQAASAAADACLRDGSTAAMPCLAASIALRRGRVDEAVEAASAALERDPDNQRAYALRGIVEAVRDSGRDERDMSRLVRVSNPPPPAGFPSMDVFSRTVAEAVRAHDMLESGTGGGPLVNGARLHDIFELTPTLANALRAMFLSEARRYAVRFPNGITPLRPGVRGWANVMTAGAHEEPHIHEGGWLSGVYYPELPAPGGSGGDIAFGPHDLGPTVPSPDPFTVSPAAGQMIMFPSWLYHSTSPFSGEGFRISVAADILRGA